MDYCTVVLLKFYKNPYFTIKSLIIEKYFCFRTIFNRIGDVMVSVLASSVVDRGFEPLSGQNSSFHGIYLKTPLFCQRKG